MEFEIQKVKKTREVYRDVDANSLIKSGWVLLAVGFDTGEEGSHQVYILGTTED